MPVLDFDRLGQLERHLHPVGDVVGDMVAPHRQHSRVPYRPLDEHGEVGRATADVDDDDAGLAFLGREHRVARRQRIEDEPVDVDPRRFHRLL